MYFLALSHAPPLLFRNSAIKIPVMVPTIRNAATASAPTSNALNTTPTAIGIPTAKSIEPGDLLIFEITPARLNRNYSAQLCRTISLGEASSQAKQHYQIIEEALETALRLVKPGTLVSEVSGAQDEVISRYGFAEYCRPPYMRARGHGFGAGRVNLSSKNHQPLEAGMAMVIHPNQYFPSVGYLALGDMVIVTDTGAERLSRLRPQIYERLYNVGAKHFMSIARIPILRHGQSVWDKALIPESEIARRLERVRRMMSETELDLLVVYGDMLNSGNLAYLTNFHSFDARMPGIALVSATELDAILKVTSRALFYIANFVWCRMHSCDFLGGDLAHKLGELAVERKLADKRVGLVGARYAPAELVRGIAEVFSAGSVEHVDQRFEALRRDKSLAERCLLRLAAAKAESVLAEVIEHARPGMTETALAAFADYAARSVGCQDAEFLVYAADELAPPSWGYEHFPFRPPAPRPLPLEHGLGVLVAVQYFGHWAELSQTLFLKEPRAGQRAACELARACFEEMLEVARRGEGGRPQWQDGTRCLWIHGTGLDREEAPYWSRSGDFLAEGDVLAAHVAAKYHDEVVFIGRPVAISQGRAATLCEASGLTLLPGSPGMRRQVNRDARLA